uniref:G-protein coupled receptors family 1 profile domain-containing protein n=1 Tax=Acrobeloides nanus TaxID=290746 RepID=A0A914DJE5_9BILA
MDTSSISPQDYYNSAPFDGFSYSSYVQAYYFTTGILSTIGNLYIIILFVTFIKLRQLQCNWLIVFLCTCDVLVGIGTLIRGSTIVYAKNNLIVYIPTYTCSLLTIPFVMGYRVGQAIALMIALDRFVAIWKPFSYNKYQGPKTTLIFGIIGILIAGLLIFLIFYGADLGSSETLDNCNSPLGVFYFQVVPSYSGIVSVLFFGFYLTSLITLYRHLAATKKQQAHAQENLSRVQLKVFITVSYALSVGRKKGA